MNVKNRIEVLEEMVGDLVDRVNELVKTNHSLVKENLILRDRCVNLIELIKKPKEKVDLEKDYFKVYIRKDVLDKLDEK